MKLYSVYGLTLESALSLPDLLPGQGRADAQLRIEATESDTSRECKPIRCASNSAKHVHLTWETVGDLWIEEGRLIRVCPAAGVEPAALSLFILGAGLGVLLHQRGLLVLHASAVAIDGRVFAFAGAKGSGKSTTAAALYRRGHLLIADELLAVRLGSQDEPRVMPGPPQVRLWSDALAAVGECLERAVPVRHGVDKFNLPVSNTATADLPISGLYLLDLGEIPCVEAVSPSEAFFGLVPHLYISRFGTPFLRSSNFETTFRQLTLLLKTVPVIRLRRPPDLGLLADTVRLVETDALREVML